MLCDNYVILREFLDLVLQAYVLDLMNYVLAVDSVPALSLFLSEWAILLSGLLRLDHLFKLYGLGLMHSSYVLFKFVEARYMSFYFLFV